jgi:DNA topoisomerase-3
VKSHNGFIEVKGGYLVTWAIGHLVQLVSPQTYDPSWKRFAWETLPMIPHQWQMEPIERTASHYKIVSALVKKATTIVIATYAGREGELIGREILELCKFKGKVMRLWASTLTAADLRHAFQNLLPGAEKEPLWEAAKARQHADWLIGLNMTRGVTLAANGDGVLPVGRVKTPTLAMVVKRDLAIANFKSAAYYELEATVQTKKGETFVLRHAPAEADRITSEAEAKSRMARAESYSGPIKVEDTAQTQRPPMPYTLTSLQAKCNAVLGLSAQMTLDIAQILYEKKKMLSYPRSDCEYLGESLKAQIPGVLSAVSKTFPRAVAALGKTGPVVRTSVFDDSKLTDHHGIIPTGVSEPLSGTELAVYKLVAQRYLEVLSADMHYRQLKLNLDANGVDFRATGRTNTAPGWLEVRNLMD